MNAEQCFIRVFSSAPILRFLMGVIVRVTLDFMIDIAEVIAVTKMIHVSLKYW